MGDANPSDGALVKRACSGDAGAFELLVRRHARAAFAVAIAMLGEHADAEDICQDSWVRALEHLEQCRDPERFVFWLLQIVRNQARNYLDYRRVRTAEPLEWTARGGTEPQDPGRQSERWDLRRLLEKALAQLPEIQREIVLLHDLDGWRHRAIAESLGISEVMSRKHLFEARHRLRALLDGRSIRGIQL